MRLQTPRRSTDEYIDAVYSTNYFNSGEWFPANYLCESLRSSGFKTTTNKMLAICNILFDDGILDKYMAAETPRDRRCMYRKRVHGREYLSRAWRKHTNEELGIEDAKYC